MGALTFPIVAYHLRGTYYTSLAYENVIFFLSMLPEGSGFYSIEIFNVILDIIIPRNLYERNTKIGVISLIRNTKNVSGERDKEGGKRSGKR